MRRAYPYLAPVVLLGLTVGCGQPAAPTKSAAPSKSPESAAPSEASAAQVTLHVKGMV
jgi:hypothetical protein